MDKGVADVRRISRRRFLQGLALAGSSATLAACAPQVVERVVKETVAVKETVMVAGTPQVVEKSVTVAPQAKVTIEWWWLWGGVKGLEGLKALSEAFNAQSDSIAVKSLVPAGDINEKYTTSIAAGNPPDLAVGVWTAFSELAARGGLMPLDEWLKASAEIKQADFFPGLFESSTWMGKVYGLAVAENGPRQGLLYNVDLAKDAGLDPAKPPQTWDEALEWHKAMTKFDKAGNLTVVGLDPLDAMGGRTPSADADILWANSLGFKWWNQTEMTFDFSQELFVQSLQIIKDFYDVVGVTKMEGYRSNYGTWTGSPQASFPAGVEGMVLEGYWAPPWLKVSGPKLNLAATWTPVSTERKGKKIQNVGGHQGNIPKGAQHPAEAFKLMEFLITEPASDINYTSGGFFSPRKAWVQKNTDKIIQEFPTEKYFIQSAFEADEYWPSPLCPIVGFVGSEWTKAVNAVNYGKKTPKQAADDLQKAATAEMDKQRSGFVK